MSSRAGGLYGGIQFSSTKPFLSTQGPASPPNASSTETALPATPAPAAETSTSAQNAAASTSATVGGESGAPAKPTAGIPPFATACAS
ncbi:hypothetical protein L226DRAFT_536195 [Lentinus tigrinus ALCF2SS1-7]|uniref:uncharacterized protein n=1 Tax=Lentinus tigrinus ALCF2SS1-7 TaxID=1328758 RepID=UPI001165CB29|nr:hypothetical protein L226DRAFT_536195 [Lentinus tigrinus ALCF2SS1-7]